MSRVSLPPLCGTAGPALVGGAAALAISRSTIGADLHRRAFLAGVAKLVLLGGAASAVPGVLSGCEVGAEMLQRIVASILDYLSNKAKYALSDALSGDPDRGISGRIKLKNEKASDIAGKVDMELISSEEIQEDAGYGEYAVPAGYVNTYAWSGLQASTEGTFSARSFSAVNSADTDPFLVSG
jgi:hypothetical protein